MGRWPHAGRRRGARRSSSPDCWCAKSGGPSDRPFCCANCDGGHGATRGVVLQYSESDEVGRPGVSKMSYHQRPHELRLAISSEAEALFSDFGGEAYAEACRRASEASSDSLARDWSVVAATIARRSGWRSIRARRLIRLRDAPDPPPHPATRLGGRFERNIEGRLSGHPFCWAIDRWRRTLRGFRTMPPPRGSSATKADSPSNGMTNGAVIALCLVRTIGPKQIAD